ncbi:uncharacterized protein BYT42DRAFT_589184 [Radiomyces spectabilis]|uniref:uncharacterized protein n=1 Tax=Radiomyces spectabilis TaxID=64574 RepID=UPI0022200A99|nr:uncharacterized protein BYT42DRAFT_589184 [Radiomyces spectabilis]KAI8365215.1 hypothetical protein BYT42DRAFT_589184 [Radiomyces spectabilis]
MPLTAPSYTGRQLLHLPPTAGALADFLHAYTPKDTPLPEPTVKRFPDCTYHSYKPLGISFCFTPQTKGDDSTLQLDSIDIYNGHTRDGFAPFTGELPCNLTPTMQAHEIVNMLGEPDRKGGGGKLRVPCWIEYQFEDNQGGLLIQLHGIDWDDREMGWTSLALF